MFLTEENIENGFSKIILRDQISKTFVEIIPSCGAILHSFSVLHNNSFFNVIDNYDSAADFAVNVTSKGFKSCKLSPFACRINHAQYSFAGKNYTIKKFLLNGSALHGLLYDAGFDITAHHSNDEGAYATMQYQYRGSDEGYPFQYDCIVTYGLEKDNVLTISTKIINKDKGLIPLQDGWHPYFTFGDKIDELQLEFQSKECVIFNEAMIPTGELISYSDYTSIKKINDEFFDNCFTLNFAECQPMCILRDTAKKMQVEIHPDKNYPYLQIYTPPHRKSIAIENLSAPPDTFNNKLGLIVLSPETNITFTTKYKITLLI